MEELLLIIELWININIGLLCNPLTDEVLETGLLYYPKGSSR